MDYIKDLHELCDTISDAIADANDKIRSGGGKLTSGDVDYVDKLTHSLKSVKAVIAMMDDGRSGRRYSMDDSSKRRMHYSRSRGMVDELRDLMEDAPDERTRMEFQRFISKIENM